MNAEGDTAASGDSADAAVGAPPEGELSRTLGARVRALAVVSGLAVVGLLAGALVQLVVDSVSTAFDPPAIVRIAVAQAGFASALGFTALGYVVVTRRPLRYFDVRLSRRDVAWAVVGLLAMLGVLVATRVGADALGLPEATHATVAQIRRAPLLGLSLVPVALLFVGPGEDC